MLNEAYDLVKEFQLQAGQIVNNTPTCLSGERVIVRYQWMLDEIKEFLEANDIYQQADAIMDLLYYVLGTLVEMGLKPDELFILLHEWNLKKINGTVCYDENGKILKPKGWRHPDREIKEIIDHMDSV